MKKAILLPIESNQLLQILNGEKTIDIRMLMPDCDLPIDVYLYCKVGKPELLRVDKSKTYIKGYGDIQFILSQTTGNDYNKVNGQIIAKYNLKTVEKFDPYVGHPKLYVAARVGDFDPMYYAKGKDFLYAWYISDLEILDEPKETNDFIPYDKHNESMGEVTKMRNWMYVWVKEENKNE